MLPITVMERNGHLFGIDGIEPQGRWVSAAGETRLHEALEGKTRPLDYFQVVKEHEMSPARSALGRWAQRIWFALDHMGLSSERAFRAECFNPHLKARMNVDRIARGISEEGVVRKTVQTRLDIGFAAEGSEHQWRDADAEYNGHTLTIQGHPVMEDWETTYMARLAAFATLMGGTVLEVGFGMGISARYIQKGDIREHIIIELNRQVADSARLFAARTPHPVQVLEGAWQEVIHEIPEGSLDGILFDTYPLKPEEVHRNHYPFIAEAHRTLRRGGVFTYYSDEALGFSPRHIEALRASGYSLHGIYGEVVPVQPPPGCKYWTHPTMLAPLVVKI